jgi:hypothetical protein
MLLDYPRLLSPATSLASDDRTGSGSKKVDRLLAASHYCLIKYMPKIPKFIKSKKFD